MVYIVETNPTGFNDFSQECGVFDTYDEAYKCLCEWEACHANELEYRLYEATNEWTSKRKLLLSR